MSRSVLLLATWSLIQSVLASRCDIIGIALEVLQRIECETCVYTGFQPVSRSVLLLATWSLIQSVLASGCDIFGITLEVLQHIECEACVYSGFLSVSISVTASWSLSIKCASI